MIQCAAERPQAVVARIPDERVISAAAGCFAFRRELRPLLRFRVEGPHLIEPDFRAGRAAVHDHRVRNRIPHGALRFGDLEAFAEVGPLVVGERIDLRVGVRVGLAVESALHDQRARLRIERGRRLPTRRRGGLLLRPRVLRDVVRPHVGPGIVAVEKRFASAVEHEAFMRSVVEEACAETRARLFTARSQRCPRHRRRVELPQIVDCGELGGNTSEHPHHAVLLVERAHVISATRRRGALHGDGLP